MEASIGRKGHLVSISLGHTWTWAQVEDGKGGNWTGEVRKGLHEELLWAARHEREVQTRSGGGRAGAPSRWTVYPRPVERGGRISGCKER